MLARKPGKVVLSMEMFERDVQAVVDDYLAGRIDEPTFTAKARAWQNYHTAYRPLVETAKAAKIPVVAANFPAMLRRKLAQGGKAAIDALPPAQRVFVPDEIFPASAGYWERVDRAVRGHMGGPMGAGGTPEARLYDAQNLWDNAMGENVARAAHPGTTVLHVAGGFHVAYRDGTVAQFARRSPGSTTAVVQIVPTARAHDARPDRDRELADFLVYAEAHAREFNEGNYAVAVPAELRYRLHVDEHRPGQPLLVWLPDRATRTEDAFDFWRLSVGEHAAVAVVEAPFPELQGDLAPGGRYAFGDGFRADYSRVQLGIARLVEFVTRRYPVDGTKVVVAGAGDGGAAVLWAALYGEWLEADFVALDPTDLTRLSMEGLPDVKPAARALHLLARNVEAERLEKVAADFTKVGTSARVVALPAAGVRGFLSELLGMPGLAAQRSGQEPVYLVLRENLPRGREWAGLHAARLRLQGIDAQVVTPGEVPPGTPPERRRELVVGEGGQWPASAFADGVGLPLAGGPFGGTTVVVLPSGTSQSERETWLAHEKNKVIKKRSMFANIAVAAMAGSPSLPEVVEQLRARGRSRFLIVPAVFCTSAATMRALEAELGSAAAGADVSWLPGFGAELVEAAGR
ncbi:MAG: hypothetical protein FJ265_18095 [Planctomycetes bacterium]|nr:hypothetical protein [Planctomycetota bacterium]